MKSKAFLYCAVCRRNHDQGKGHRYSTGHRNALQSALSKIREKIQTVRALLENPRASAPPIDRFWCLFCEEDVVTDDRKSSFACSKVIDHLASPVHLSNIKSFWRENGVDANTRHDFFFSNKEVAIWEAICSDGTSTDSIATRDGIRNNIHNEPFNVANSSRNPRVCVEPLPDFSKDQTLQVAGHNGATPAHRYTMAASGGNLATVNPQPLVSSEGNVHSGAPPPWLSDLPTHAGGDECPKGISKRKRKEMERLDKRVGAAWANRRKAELERIAAAAVAAPRNQLESDWLPSFGRVWQNGSRRDSRREFEKERKMLDEATKLATPAVQPYVGKRKRLETGLQTGGEKHDQVIEFPKGVQGHGAENKG